MDNNNFDNKISDDINADLSLEAILAEFKTGKDSDLNESLESPRTAADLDDGFGRSIRETGFFSISGDGGSTGEKPSAESLPMYTDDKNDSGEHHARRKMSPRPAGRSRAAEQVHSLSEKSDSTESEASSAGAAAATSASPAGKIFDLSPDGGEGRTKYAPRRSYELPEDELEEKDERPPSPIAQLFSESARRREENRRKRLERASEQAKNKPPEMRADKASELYLAQAQSLRLRFRFSLLLCIILVYLSYGLPAFGALGDSVIIRSLVCLVLELTVMVIGLDIITNGIVSLFKGHPGVESLIAVSCIMSAIDALVTVITGNIDAGLPYCAVSALSVMFALLGSFLSCASYAVNFRVVSLTKAPSLIISHDCTIDKEQVRVLAKVRRPATGFVRASEEADIFETLYGVLAPFLIIASFVLGVFCYFASEDCTKLVHTISTCTSVAASFSAILGFALPFSVLTKKLARSGAAVAGYSGCAELGRLKRVVITDSDLFPRRTVSIADVHIEEGYYPEHVIAYTGSMIAAAGLGIAPAFTELMKKNGSAMQKVEDFACHAGGGVIARINGDNVYVGNASFMYLMGIRMRKEKNSDCTVYTAINDNYVGKFKISYTPMMSVTNALSTLLSGRTVPVFAIRDFNLTPMLVDKFFRLHSGVCDYPSFSDRYSISSREAQQEGSVAASFAKGGLSAVSGLMKRGRRLYVSSVLCAALSVLGTVAGMLLMLALCWSGAYDSASCGNILTFMLLWLVPVLVISLGLRR